MGLGIILGSAATAAKDTYERMNAEKRREAEFKEQERQREQRKALEEQSAALPAIGAKLDTNTMPETQRNALGIKLTPDQSNMVQPSDTPAPPPLWQQNAQGVGLPGMAGVVADNKASGAMPTHEPNNRTISQADQMMMLADVYRRNGQPDKALELAQRGAQERSKEWASNLQFKALTGGYDAIAKEASMFADGNTLKVTPNADGGADATYGKMSFKAENPLQLATIIGTMAMRDPMQTAQVMHQFEDSALRRKELDNNDAYRTASLKFQSENAAADRKLRQLQLQLSQSTHDLERKKFERELNAYNEVQDRRKTFMTLLQDPVGNEAELRRISQELYTLHPESAQVKLTTTDADGNKQEHVVNGMNVLVDSALEGSKAVYEKNPWVAGKLIAAHPQGGYEVRGLTENGSAKLFPTLPAAVAAAKAAGMSVNQKATPASAASGGAQTTGLPLNVSGKEIAASQVPTDTLVSKYITEYEALSQRPATEGDFLAGPVTQLEKALRARGGDALVQKALAEVKRRREAATAQRQSEQAAARQQGIDTYFNQ